MIGNLSDELDPLRVRGMVNTALKNTTSMAMSSDFDTVGSDSIVNELD